jgi:citrate synthase
MEPTDMFTVMFAIGRLPGWIAQWKEMRENKEWKTKANILDLRCEILKQ